MISRSDTLIIGGGMVGSAIAVGLARMGLKVTVLDGADDAERAARANFGLVWGQSKGDSLPDYARWTREALYLWPQFQNDLLHETGVTCHFAGEGGLHLCVSEKELEDRRALFDRMRRIEGANGLELKILDHKEVAELLPGVGPDVIGAGYCGQDGHVSPHALLRSMQLSILKSGGSLLSNRQVTELSLQGGIWTVRSGEERFETPSLVLAAGTGNRTLGKLIGLDIPVFPLKGQILVSERVTPRMDLPTHKVRQTEAGTILLGDSKEPEAGSDDRSSQSVIRDIARRGIQMFPWLSEVNLVRTWAGIRSMTEDSFPIYDTFSDFPGLFAANCHSGVTLAPVHAMRLAPMIAEATYSPQIAAMSARRFHVQAH
ncbi:MAG: NAD(P)/FAD-dependent oxidoreductase [Jhaorihella sp.]